MAMGSPQERSDRDIRREHIERGRMYLERAKAKREPARRALEAAQRELDRMRSARGR